MKITCSVLRRGKESNFFLLSDYWLLQNKKKYKKRDHYQILTLKGSCSDIEKKTKKLGNDKLVAVYTMALIKDNKSLDFLPNYVTLKNGEQIDKAEYVDMVIRTEAYIRANGRLPAIVYRMSKLPDYNDSTMKLFIKTFSFKGNTIDEALAVIAKKRLYSKYFDSQKTDKKQSMMPVRVKVPTVWTGDRFTTE